LVLLGRLCSFVCLLAGSVSSQTLPLISILSSANLASVHGIEASGNRVSLASYVNQAVCLMLALHNMIAIIASSSLQLGRRYETAKKKGDYDEETQQRENAKQALERYMHYYQRWAENDKARLQVLTQVHFTDYQSVFSGKHGSNVMPHLANFTSI